MPDAFEPHTPSAVRLRHDLFGAMAVTSLVGLLDGVVAAVSGRAILAILLCVGLWMLAGFAAGLVWHLLLRLVLTSSARAHWHRTLGAPFTNAPLFGGDRDASARVVRLVVALVVALAVFVGLSFTWAFWLLEHRHGNALIAIGIVAGQLLVLVVAFYAAMLVLRVTAPVHNWLAGRRRDPAKVLVWVIGLPLLASSAHTMWRHWEVVRATEGHALLVAVLVMLALPIAGYLVAQRRPGLRAQVPLVLIGVALLATLVTARSSAARLATMRGSLLSGRILDIAGKLSDVDGDGAPAFPLWVDCAPFDASRHPLASERPGNGVDESCDGLDEIPPFRRPLRVAPEIVAPAGQPSLVLITIDSLRPDYLGFGGATRAGISPNLDRLANQAVVFEQAFSQDSGTGPSLWSLMAGKTPFQTRVDNSGRFPPNFLKDETLLAEVLQRAGYRTEALLCGSVFAGKRWNIDRGFDSLQEVCGRETERQAPIVTRRALPTIQRLLASPQPFFLWLHYYDPHHPYANHPHFDYGTDAKARYQEEISYTDDALGEVLRALTTDHGRRLYIALTADHGENFGEHGQDPHARTLYRQVTHVPLLFWGSDLKPRRVHELAALDDIHPTFLELAHQSFAHSTMATQVPVLFGAAADATRLVYQENSFSRPKRHVKGVVGEGHHLLRDLTLHTSELYDLRADPEETQNLAGRGLPVEAKLQQALLTFIPTTKVPTRLAK